MTYAVDTEVVHDNTAASLTFSKSAFPNLADGQTLVAIIGQLKTNGSANWTAPSGWTLSLIYSTSTSNDHQLVLAYKYIADAVGEPATWTFGNGAEGNEKSGIMMSFENLAATDPLNASAFDINEPVYTGVPPEITTTVDDCLILTNYAALDSAYAAEPTWGVPSGTELEAHGGGGSGDAHWLAVASLLLPSASTLTLGAWSNTGGPNDSSKTAIFAFEREFPAVEPAAVNWKVELAVGAAADFSSLWDYGEWDDAVWGGADPVWIDVSSTVESVRINRGKQRFGERMRTGIAQVVLSDTDGRYTPEAGAAGPGALELRPGRLIRVSSQVGTEGEWIPQFTGTVISLDPSYGTGGSEPRMMIQAQDPAGELAQFGILPLDTPISAGQGTDDRINRVLDEYEWSTDDRSGIQTGDHTMAASDLSASGLEECQRAADAEGGAFFFDKSGSPQFRAFGWLDTDTRSTNVQLEIGTDTTDAAEVIDSAASWSLLRIVNLAQLTRVDGSNVIEARSTLSQSLFGVKLFRKQYHCQTDVQLQNLADEIVRVNQLDRLRLERVTIWGESADTAAAILGLELGDLVRCKIETLQDWSYQIDAHIVGIVANVTASDWALTLMLDDSYTLT